MLMCQNEASKIIILLTDSDQVMSMQNKIPTIPMGMMTVGTAQHYDICSSTPSNLDFNIISSHACSMMALTPFLMNAFTVCLQSWLLNQNNGFLS